MRITGCAAAIQYIKRYVDDLEEEDLDIAIWIGDGYLEWDPVTEMIYKPPLGEMYFHNSGIIH